MGFDLDMVYMLDILGMADMGSVLQVVPVGLVGFDPLVLV